MSEASPASRPNSPRAFHSPLSWVLLLSVLAIGLATDLSTKSWTFATVADDPVFLVRDTLLADPFFNPVPRHESKPVLPWDLLHFQLVINRGAVFGIGADKRIFFIVFTIGALAAALLVFARWTGRGALLAHVAIGLILAGGLGNLYDRLCFSVVRDFMHMLPGWKLPWGWHWPGCSTEIFPWVFNVADVMLPFGMGMLMLHINRAEKRRKLANAAASQAPHQGQPESA